jgi:hypothetical protein
VGALTRYATATSVRIIGVGMLAGLGAVVAVLALSHSVSAPAIAPSAPVEVSASFDHAFVQFGDGITARVVVALDTRLVQAQTLRVADDFAPLTQLGAVRTSRSTQGRLELVTFAVPVACLTAPCVAGTGQATVHLPLVRASVLERGGRAAHASVRWPTLLVRGRVTAQDLKPSTPPFKADTTPLAATYRIAPATLAALLDVLAVLCAVSAVGLVGRGIHQRLHRRASRPGALERALELTRQAEQRPVEDRRRALALLGRALGGDRRSRAARRLAWSEPAPESGELEELVRDIEQRRPE